MSRFPKPTIDQLRDESSLSGHAEGILNPTNEKEAAEMIRENKDLEIRFQGTRTGICGGSVPDGGLMLGTAFMKWVADPETDGDDLLSWVGAGVTSMFPLRPRAPSSSAPFGPRSAISPMGRPALTPRWPRPWARPTPSALWAWRPTATPCRCSFPATAWWEKVEGSWVTHWASRRRNTCSIWKSA